MMIYMYTYSCSMTWCIVAVACSGAWALVTLIVEPASVFTSDNKRALIQIQDGSAIIMGEL
jgi:hypothetical protein